MCTGTIATFMAVNVIYIMNSPLMIVTMMNRALIMRIQISWNGYLATNRLEEIVVTILGLYMTVTCGKIAMAL